MMFILDNFGTIFAALVVGGFIAALIAGWMTR